MIEVTVAVALAVAGVVMTAAGIVVGAYVKHEAGLALVLLGIALWTVALIVGISISGVLITGHWH